LLNLRADDLHVGSHTKEILCGMVYLFHHIRMRSCWIYLCDDLPVGCCLRAFDSGAAQCLDRHIFHTSIYRNVSELRQMVYRSGFDEVCSNFTREERTELSLRWGHDMEDFILTVDDIREHSLIPSILQVNSLINILDFFHILCPSVLFFFYTQTLLFLFAVFTLVTHQRLLQT